MLSHTVSFTSDCMLLGVIRSKKKKVIHYRYNGSYFDRLAPPDETLCDSQGLFQCEGPYNQCRCPGLHFINPYASREARIVFSTWNFDHV